MDPEIYDFSEKKEEEDGVIRPCSRQNLENRVPVISR